MWFKWSSIPRYSKSVVSDFLRWKSRYQYFCKVILTYLSSNSELSFDAFINCVDIDTQEVIYRGMFNISNDVPNLNTSYEIKLNLHKDSFYKILYQHKSDLK